MPAWQGSGEVVLQDADCCVFVSFHGGGEKKLAGSLASSNKGISPTYEGPTYDLIISHRFKASICEFWRDTDI